MTAEPRTRPLAGHERELLASGSPLEVLARIVPEDALGLWPRIGARLGAQALLCDAERVLLQATEVLE